VAGCCVHGNEPSGSFKGVLCFDHLSDYQLVKYDSAYVFLQMRTTLMHCYMGVQWRIFGKSFGDQTPEGWCEDTAGLMTWVRTVVLK
jgi:hypothetical protein